MNESRTDFRGLQDQMVCFITVSPCESKRVGRILNDRSKIKPVPPIAQITLISLQQIALAIALGIGIAIALGIRIAIALVIAITLGIELK